ncbi:MAG: B12-binding domain-containing radical SAM protein [Nitrospirae bacterium]|nr:B12-binding domain-containing radical SAM protein [Nitrospirota bacterium]
MKCLLISLQSNSYVTGLKYIAANVLDKGHDARILLLSGYLERDLHPAIEEFISDYNPDLIGISLMAIEYYPAKNLTRLLREKFQVPIIWGGVHVTTDPEDCLKHADYLCIGEGECVVPAVLEHLRSEGKGVVPDIPGVWTRLNGKETRQPFSASETDLDSLPVQDYLPEYFFGLHKNRIYNFAQNPELFRSYALYGGTCHMMITTRGCPFNCGYCANASLSKVYGSKVRERSVENCLEELKRVKKDPYVLYINFQDDCFFIHNREWIKKFCEEYKKHISLPFMVRAIPTLLDREKLFMLKEAGLSVVIMGIQSGSDHVNFDIYNRKIKFQSVMKAAELISEVKALPYYEMIVDNPYETEDDMIETINSMSRLRKPYTVSLAHLTFFPGTPLTEKALKDKIVDPEAYLSRFMVNIDYTYLNKVLYLAPYMPRALIKLLNKPASVRRTIHSILTGSLFFFAKRSIEPLVYMFLISRSLNYNIKWTARTFFSNWRSALAKLLFNFLSKGDMEFNERLALARKEMPSLFEK